MPEIVVSRRIAAPPAVVYTYLTQSDLWSGWQGVAAAIEATPGGAFGMSMPNGMKARGEFVELVPNRRVVFTWGWVGHPGLPPGSSVVEVDLAEDGTGTLVTLTHRGLPPDEVPVHTAGWDHYLLRLAVVATDGDPGPDPGPG